MGLIGETEGLTLKCLDCDKTLVVMSPNIFLPSKQVENYPCETSAEFCAS